MREALRSGVIPMQQKKAGQGQSMTDAYYQTLPFDPDIMPAAELQTGDRRATEDHASAGYLQAAATVDGIATPRRRLTIYSHVRGFIGG